MALDILFEHEIAGTVVDTILERYSSNPGFDFAADLVRGVAQHQPDIDAALAGHSGDWPLERMPAIDRTLLRLATYEICFGGQVSAAIAINEAVEIAKIYSTEDSSRFINGVLAKIAGERP